MRSVKDLYYKIMRLSLVSAVLSFVAFLIDLGYLLVKGAIEINGSFEISNEYIMAEALFWILLVSVLIALVLARIMYDLQQKQDKLLDVESYREQLRQQDSSSTDIDIQTEIDRLEEDSLGEKIKAFFATIADFFRSVKDAMIEKRDELKANREQKKLKKIELQEELRQKREEEMALIEAEEKLEEEKRLIQEQELEKQRKIEEEKRIKEEEILAEKLALMTKEKELEEKKAEDERLRQEILDRKRAEQVKAQEDAKRLKEEADKKAVEQVTQEETEKQVAKDEVIEEPVVANKKPKPKAKPKIITKTKTDIIELIFETTDISKNKANKFLKYFAETVKESLEKKEDVVIEHFGTFTTIEMPEKEAVNPQTNEKIIVPAHHQVRFRVDDEFKDKF